MQHYYTSTGPDKDQKKPAPTNSRQTDNDDEKSVPRENAEPEQGGPSGLQSDKNPVYPSSNEE